LAKGLASLVPLEILDVGFVLVRSHLAGEGAEITPLAGFAIKLARIDQPLAGLEFCGSWA
jgi:hypothetical protein